MFNLSTLDILTLADSISAQDNRVAEYRRRHHRNLNRTIPSLLKLPALPLSTLDWTVDNADNTDNTDDYDIVNTSNTVPQNVRVEEPNVGGRVPLQYIDLPPIFPKEAPYGYPHLIDVGHYLANKDNILDSDDLPLWSIQHPDSLPYGYKVTGGTIIRNSQDEAGIEPYYSSGDYYGEVEPDAIQAEREEAVRNNKQRIIEVYGGEIHIADGICTLLYNWKPESLDPFLDLKRRRFGWSRRATMQDGSVQVTAIFRQDRIVTVRMRTRPSQYIFSLVC